MKKVVRSTFVKWICLPTDDCSVAWNIQTDTAMAQVRQAGDKHQKASQFHFEKGVRVITVICDTRNANRIGLSFIPWLVNLIDMCHLLSEARSRVHQEFDQPSITSSLQKQYSFNFVIHRVYSSFPVLRSCLIMPITLAIHIRQLDVNNLDCDMSGNLVTMPPTVYCICSIHYVHLQR